MGNVPGYGSRSKLAQVYPYRFCKTLAVSLAHFLNRWQYGRSNIVVEDLLSELSDSEVSCLTDAFDQEYVFYTESPHNHSKLKQDSNLRQLMTKVNSLKAGTEYHLSWASSDDKWVRTARQQASEVRQKLVPGTVFGECILYRGTLGVNKHLRESQQGILVFWHKHQKNHAVSVKPVYEVDWKQTNPSTFLGVLYSHTGTSVKLDRTNDPHDVIIPDTIMTDTGQPYDWPEDKANKLTFSYLSQKAQRKEATATEKRQLKKQFDEAKQAEYQSWLDNEVFELVDMRKLGKIKYYVTGRWVLTVKRDKDGNFLKTKARWVLRGFQDRQKDSPIRSRRIPLLQAGQVSV